MIMRVGKRVRAGEGDGAPQSRKPEHVLHRRRDLARRRRLLLLRSCSGRQPRAVLALFLLAQRIAERVLGRQRLAEKEFDRRRACSLRRRLFICLDLRGNQTSVAFGPTSTPWPRR